MLPRRELFKSSCILIGSTFHAQTRCIETNLSAACLCWDARPQEQNVLAIQLKRFCCLQIALPQSQWHFQRANAQCGADRICDNGFAKQMHRHSINCILLRINSQHSANFHKYFTICSETNQHRTKVFQWIKFEGFFGQSTKINTFTHTFRQKHRPNSSNFWLIK